MIRLKPFPGEQDGSQGTINRAEMADSVEEKGIDGPQKEEMVSN